MKSIFTVLAILLIGSGLIAGPVYLAEAASPAQAAEEGQAIFQTKCSSCHNIGGGKLVGPDLENITNQRDLDWLREFIANPDWLINSGDPIASQLMAEYNNIAMPNLGLKDSDVAALLAYLENPTPGQAASQPAVPLPSGSELEGQKLFTGEKKIANGGTACIACHSVNGSGALGGGNLGPDLTMVYSRMGGPGLESSLSNIVFPTMQGPFLNRPLTAQEQADLIAFFAWSDQNAPASTGNLTQIFIGAGAVGAVVLFGIMAVFWPRQKQSISDRLRKKG